MTETTGGRKEAMTTPKATAAHPLGEAAGSPSRGVTTNLYWCKVWGLGFGVENPMRVLYGDGIAEARWVLCGKLYLGPLLVNFFVPLMKANIPTCVNKEGG